VHLESFHTALTFIHEGYGITGATFDNWRPIVHRDIKPENVLVTTNGTTYPSFKLGDFEIPQNIIQTIQIVHVIPISGSYPRFHDYQP